MYFIVFAGLGGKKTATAFRWNETLVPKRIAYLDGYNNVRLFSCLRDFIVFSMDTTYLFSTLASIGEVFKTCDEHIHGERIKQRHHCPNSHCASGRRMHVLCSDDYTTQGVKC